MYYLTNEGFLSTFVILLLIFVELYLDFSHVYIVFSYLYRSQKKTIFVVKQFNKIRNPNSFILRKTSLEMKVTNRNRM